DDRVGRAAIVHHRVRGNARATRRSDDARTPIAEAVAIRRHRYGRIEHQIVVPDQIGDARKVHVQIEYHGSWLRTIVGHLEADANLHHESPVDAVTGAPASRAPRPITSAARALAGIR